MISYKVNIKYKKIITIHQGEDPNRQIGQFYQIFLLYVQEVVTLQKKIFNILHQKMRFTPFINYYNTLGLILLVYRGK